MGGFCRWYEKDMENLTEHEQEQCSENGQECCECEDLIIQEKESVVQEAADGSGLGGIKMKNKTINALLEMGMPADIKGFRYITEIMCLYDNDNELIDGNLMGVYETIAKQNDTTVSRVERVIRHAFSILLERVDLQTYRKYLDTPHRKNGALLATLYYRLKMEE